MFGKHEIQEQTRNPNIEKHDNNKYKKGNSKTNEIIKNHIES